MATATSQGEEDRVASFMEVIDPSDQLRHLHSLDIQVEYETLLAATRQCPAQSFVAPVFCVVTAAMRCRPAV